MAFTRTNDLIEKLTARLKALKLDPENAQAIEPLFQKVAAFGANRLAEAMKSVFASDQRVCFIVPGGDAYTGTRDRSLLFSKRSSRFALLIADRSLDQDKNAALIGGKNNLGILELKDLVIDSLVTTAIADSTDLAFEPAEGEPLLISDTEKASGNLGRECWLQWLGCYAGTARIVIP